MNITKQFSELKAKPLEECKQEIKPLFVNEYNSMIIDYEKEMVAVTNRLIPPYITSQTHGDVYTDLVNYIVSLGVKEILELGCAAGELLHLLNKHIDSCNLYGNTIHLGEVKYAREIFGLENIVGMDMRDIDKYFNNDSFDLIISHHSFLWISIDERIDVSKQIHKLLKSNGYFIYVDYRREENSKYPEWDYSKYYNKLTSPTMKTMGEVSIFRKI